MIQSIRAQAFSWIGSRLGGEASLRRRTLVGSQWLILRSLVQAGLEAIKVSVFARLLFPEDCGLMALAALPIGLLVAFSAAHCFPLTAAFGTVGTAWAVVLSGLVSHGLTFVFARMVPASAKETSCWGIDRP
jgi:hypothetical protein